MAELKDPAASAWGQGDAMRIKGNIGSQCPHRAHRSSDCVIGILHLVLAAIPFMEEETEAQRSEVPKISQPV